MERSDPTQLPRHLLHLSTLQIVTQSSPFTHARTLPLHLLSDLLQDYFALLATGVKERAEQAGRDKVCVWDVGATLEEFGSGPVDTLMDEVRRSKSAEETGEDDEGLRIHDVAKQLQEYLGSRRPAKPIARLAYDVVHSIEIQALHTLPDLVPSSFDSPPSDADDDLGSPVASTSLSRFNDTNHHRSAPSVSFVKQEDTGPNLFLDAWDQEGGFDLAKELDMLNLPIMPQSAYRVGEEDNEDDEDEDPALAWRDPSLIPAWVPEFLPPFPGMERQREAPLVARRRREQADSAWDGRPRGAQYAAGGDAWLAPIPYNTSMLSDMHPITHLPPLSPPPASPTLEDEDPLLTSVRARKRRRRAISPPPTTTDSLDAYRTALPEIFHPAAYRRPNIERRRAAAVIGLHPDLSIAGVDSLFGLLPMPWTRQPTRPPGYLPETAVTTLIHPFNTPLPHTASAPVPYHEGASGTHLSAPVPHPRVPTTLARAKDQLFKPSETNNNLAIFSRLTRIGPPGPLGPKGEALDYEYVGQTSIIALNVEWPVRMHNQRLPIREDDPVANGSNHGTGPSGTPAASGIKLRLGRNGSNSVAGSPAPPGQPTPGPWSSSFNQSFAGSGQGSNVNGVGRGDSPVQAMYPHRDSMGSMTNRTTSREPSILSQEVADILAASGIPLDVSQLDPPPPQDEDASTSTNDLFNQLRSSSSEQLAFDPNLFGFAFEGNADASSIQGLEEPQTPQQPVGPISFKFGANSSVEPPPGLATDEPPASASSVELPAESTSNGYGEDGELPAKQQLSVEREANAAAAAPIEPGLGNVSMNGDHPEGGNESFHEA